MNASDRIEAESLGEKLREARAHWLSSKESALGKAKEYASTALIEAVREGKKSVALDYKRVSGCLPELREWLAQSGCTLNVSSDPRDPATDVSVTWEGP